MNETDLTRLYGTKMSSFDLMNLENVKTSLGVVRDAHKRSRRDGASATGGHVIAHYNMKQVYLIAYETKHRGTQAQFQRISRYFKNFK